MVLEQSPRPPRFALFKTRKMPTLYVIASTPAGSKRGNPPVIQNSVEQMVQDAGGRGSIVFCPVNFKDKRDGSESKRSSEWKQHWAKRIEDVWHRACNTAKYDKMVIVCIKGGGRKACAWERKHIEDYYGGWTGRGGWFDSFFSGVTVSMEVWNYANGQVAKKFGLNPANYYQGEDDSEDA
eukprot:Tamp_20109.p1 GENE.Tamp_20109~~Tamp_20109.p1  ORF type:complete len:181 (-),score=30.40 Tamp_20109:279-821(-)